MITITTHGVTVEFADEIATSRARATVRISMPEGVRIVQAVIEHRQGADGGYYPVVEFKDLREGL